MDNQSPRSTSSSPLIAQCHCTSITFPVQPQIPTSEGKLLTSILLCHCSICRHSTGQLCTSYIPIAAPSALALDKTTAYSMKPSDLPAVSTFSCEREGTQRHFCTTCGCHAFRSRPREGGTAHGERSWEVATGVLSNVAAYLHTFQHINISATKDGGLSLFLLPEPSKAKPAATAKADDHPTTTTHPQAKAKSKKEDSTTTTTTLSAHCACTTISFHITRPNAHRSTIPHSPFPDLMIPYHTQDPGIANPQDEKWWLRRGAPTPPPPTTTTMSKDASSFSSAKYLAGTCACRSCRLTSGFEVQAWAFVPAGNIFFFRRGPGGMESRAGVGAGAGAGDEKEMVGSVGGEVGGEGGLDFEALREVGLKGYESSEGVMREFCPGCGATVFWHDKWRPGVVDVSVGLLEAEEGARAEAWLEWWVERVSFREDAEGRGGLVPALERGLRAYAV